MACAYKWLNIAYTIAQESFWITKQLILQFENEVKPNEIEGKRGLF